MFAEEVERADAVDGVGAREEFELTAVADAELGFVEEADLGEFMGDGFVGADAVEVAALDHEGAGGDQSGHLGVVEGGAEVPLEDFVFGGPDVTIRAARGCVFLDPFVEVGGADGEGVIRDERGDAHGGFAAVAEAVEGDA